MRGCPALPLVSLPLGFLSLLPPHFRVPLSLRSGFGKGGTVPGGWELRGQLCSAGRGAALRSGGMEPRMGDSRPWGDDAPWVPGLHGAVLEATPTRSDPNPWGGVGPWLQNWGYPWGCTASPLPSLAASAPPEPEVRCVEVGGRDLHQHSPSTAAFPAGPPAPAMHSRRASLNKPPTAVRGSPLPSRPAALRPPGPPGRRAPPAPCMSPSQTPQRGWKQRCSLTKDSPGSGAARRPLYPRAPPRRRASRRASSRENRALHGSLVWEGKKREQTNSKTPHV